MKHYYLPLIAVLFSLFATSCGDNSILDVDRVVKTDLTSPLFLAFDNTIDKPTKKIWAFNVSEAAKGTIAIVGNDVLRVNTEWYFKSWSLSGPRLTLIDQNDNKKTYDLSQVRVLGYNAIAFSTSYVCIPSSNRGIDGEPLEEELLRHGVTDNVLWEVLRKSYEEGSTLDIKLNK